MTIHDTTHTSSPRLTTTAALRALVGDVAEFDGQFWERRIGMFSAAPELTDLVTEQEMWEAAECGLLIRPYFTCFNNGVREPLDEIATTRWVGEREIPGYIDADAIRTAFAQGATYKWSQAEHWHPRIGEFIADLRHSFRGQTEAFVFLSPPGITAMPAHMDGSHVFILQVAGTKDWNVAALGDTTTGLPERYWRSRIEEDRRIEFSLTPGDVLYLPHGTPHHAQARDGNSIHIAITVEEPTTLELADVVLADCLQHTALRAVERRYPLDEPRRFAEQVRAALSDFLDDGIRPDDEYIADAVRVISHHLDD
ncbi:hypothetical protein MARA_00670 (plasmid) [Mycolicibacterium arabiense]|uniref:JmjC domain-containing protein n=1 Tax=Mycolicibacterium arabiense TaxID=1286181 RepID=A0A7I7RQ28_9MYCO|nr:cupin domain-containing protein [Mycolicibacterium arabiense]MCV7372033.1 hypothetical protein [Mycolicibacterium arabiense]BBY46637.1 hypothetical protein MARA_00670 [Mycolicibacterium arabiense]